MRDDYGGAGAYQCTNAQVPTRASGTHDVATSYVWMRTCASSLIIIETRQRARQLRLTLARGSVGHTSFRHHPHLVVTHFHGDSLAIGSLAACYSRLAHRRVRAHDGTRHYPASGAGRSSFAGGLCAGSGLATTVGEDPNRVDGRVEGEQGGPLARTLLPGIDKLRSLDSYGIEALAIPADTIRTIAPTKHGCHYRLAVPESSGPHRGELPAATGAIEHGVVGAPVTLSP